MKLLRGDEGMGSLGITLMCNACSTREDMIELFKTLPSEEIAGVVGVIGLDYYVGNRKVVIRKTGNYYGYTTLLYVIKRLEIILFKNSYSIYLLDTSYLSEIRHLPSDFKIIEI